MKDIIKKRTVQVSIFLSIVFLFLVSWMIVQPLNASPDEAMRYDIVEYIVEHGELPDGRNPEIRNGLWGTSYAFNPILAYMIMAIPAKIVSLFTSSSMAVLIAARLVNTCFGTLMAYLVFRIGEMLFEGKEKWLFVSLATFLPGLMFLHSYVNTDSMALFSIAWIVYGWVRSIKEGWTTRVCVHLALAISVCGLSYYNAYGFILVSMIFMTISILFCQEENQKIRSLISKGSFVAVIVLALVGWWFVRNAILYDGDILGRNISREYAELYAVDYLKPSQIFTPQKAGMSVLDMMVSIPEGSACSWIVKVAISFIGTFGFMDIFMPVILSGMYCALFGVGLLGALLGFRKIFLENSGKAEEKKRRVLHICLLVAMIIPFILLLVYSYTSDYQAQGRYIMPMVIPFMYFVTCGIKNLLEMFVKDGRVRDGIYVGTASLYLVGALYTYMIVFLPNYYILPMIG